MPFTYTYYEKAGLLTEKLMFLKRIYKNYAKLGYFGFETKNYHCTREEIENRIEKIKEASRIIYSNDTDYNKANALYQLFPSSKIFKRSYTLFIKYGLKDDRLTEIHEYLLDFDNLYNAYLDYENRGLIANVTYYNKIKNYLDYYEYAKYIISNYISFNGVSFNEFLDFYGITFDAFKYSLEVIKELDMDLYEKYIAQKQINDKKLFDLRLSAIKEVSYGIKTGYMMDGKDADFYTIIKTLPFKDSKDFNKTLKSFINEYASEDYEVIIPYLQKYNLCSQKPFIPIKLDMLNKVQVTINGRTITDMDNEIIVNYIRQKGLPVSEYIYLYTRNRYLEGTLDIESVKSYEPEELKLTLIPKC